VLQWYIKPHPQVLFFNSCRSKICITVK
jgi:hypothetical protein